MLGVTFKKNDLFLNNFKFALKTQEEEYKWVQHSWEYSRKYHTNAATANIPPKPQQVVALSFEAL